MDNEINYTHLLTVIRNKNIIIYGAGYIGKRFYDCLKKHGYANRVIGFVVTNKHSCSHNSIMNIPIFNIDEIIESDNVLICIAVHDTLTNEIEAELKKNNLHNYIYITPLINYLFLGEPEKENVEILIDNIVQNCHTYKIAICYLVIENYYKKNNYGFDIYLKAQKLSCSGNTAQKRLTYFCKLIENCSIDGFNCQNLISIDSNYNIIDGHHRLALGIYYKVNTIHCDVFPAGQQYVNWITPQALMCKDAFDNKTFSEGELEIIDKTYHKLRRETT